MRQELRPTVVVVGGIETDFLVEGERIADGLAEAGREAWGGKGASQAIAAARFGARVALVGKAGLDRRGEIALTRLVADGVDVAHVGYVEAPAGAVLIMSDRSGERQTMSWVADRRLTVDDVNGARAAFTSARVVLVQLEVPVPAVACAIALGRAAGAITVLDGGPAMPLGDDVLRLVDILRINPVEAAALTDVRPSDRASAARAARLLLERGVGAVMIAAGEEGDLLVTADSERLLARLAVDVVDISGASDAYAGVFAAALAEGHPLFDAAELGNVAAALASTRAGAQAKLPRRRDVMALHAARHTLTRPAQPFGRV
jgi:ribokinase